MCHDPYLCDKISSRWITKCSVHIQVVDGFSSQNIGDLSNKCRFSSNIALNFAVLASRRLKPETASCADQTVPVYRTFPWHPSISILGRKEISSSLLSALPHDIHDRAGAVICRQVRDIELAVFKSVQDKRLQQCTSL